MKCYWGDFFSEKICSTIKHERVNSITDFELFYTLGLIFQRLKIQVA